MRKNSIDNEEVNALKMSSKLEEIKNQANFLKAVTDLNPDMISVIDLKTRGMIFANTSAFIAQGFGSKLHPFEKMASDQRRNHVLTPYKSAMKNYFNAFLHMKNDEVQTLEYQAVNDRDELHWFFAQGKVFKRDDKGIPIQAISIVQNITERKRTEQEIIQLKDTIAQKANNKYFVLFNSVDQGVAHGKLIRDERGNARAIIVDEVNGVWEKIMGVKPKDVLGKNISEWLPNLDMSWIEFCQRVLDTGHPESYEATVSDLGGRWYEVFLLPLENDSFMALCTDTTPQRKAKKELENAIVLRDNFIGLASHELNTPVTSLKLYAQFLEQKFYKDGDKKSVALLTKMVEQINMLTVLISDLLDITKIERDKLIFREQIFSFDTLLLETIEQVQRTSNSHKILRRGMTRKKITADRERIKQVLINLLTNSIKYSPKATRIIISVQSSTRFVTVKVQDFGLGIAKSKQDRVFERFYREDGKEEITYPGLGIGLYVASEIIKRYQGKIWVQSVKGKGSTFCFSLPLRK